MLLRHTATTMTNDDDADTCLDKSMKCHTRRWVDNIQHLYIRLLMHKRMEEEVPMMMMMMMMMQTTTLLQNVNEKNRHT
jgi:hypothetical protein